MYYEPRARTSGKCLISVLFRTNGQRQGMPVAAIDTNRPTTKLEVHLISSLVTTLCSTNKQMPPQTAPIPSLYMTVQNEPRLRLLKIKMTSTAAAIIIIFDKSKAYQFPSMPSLRLRLPPGNTVKGYESRIPAVCS